MPIHTGYSSKEVSYPQATIDTLIFGLSHYAASICTGMNSEGGPQIGQLLSMALYSSKDIFIELRDT